LDEQRIYDECVLGHARNGQIILWVAKKNNYCAWRSKEYMMNALAFLKVPLYTQHTFNRLNCEPSSKQMFFKSRRAGKIFEWE